ncbi:Lactonase, 7-bladed beta-propeller-domain-containing protein [Geopyxis carbonaria]|nr:Lactonase, 7-bladed beta-propeller-domain-containing protein [Geopyxis carbonaria]
MTPLLLSALSPFALAARPFVVSSYGGVLTSAVLANDGTIQVKSTNNESRPSPSWFELSTKQAKLFTVEETTVTVPSEGAVTSYSIDSAGKLTKSSTAHGLARPVSLAISPDESIIMTANYGASGVSAYSHDVNTGVITHLQDWKYTLSATGTVPVRQDAPHPHQALFDPSGRFVLIPDLGADLIRIFEVSNGTVTPHDPITVPAGTGPRHGTFIDDYYYLVGEVSNAVLVYSTSIGYGGEFTMELLQDSSTLPTRTTPGAGAPNTSPSAAEIAVAPAGDFVYVSNRNDKVYANTHSIALFERDADTGLLTNKAYMDSGVKTPRHISIDPSGKFLVAEGADSQNLKVFWRNEDDGTIGDTPTATLAVAGGPVCLQWLDQKLIGGYRRRGRGRYV